MIYLDNAATSFPKPRGMSEAMDLCIRNYCGNPGRSGHSMSMRTGEEIYKARKGIAKLFGISNPDRVLFFLNTSQALNQAIKGILLPGQHVVTTPMEHNSVLRPLEKMKYQDISYTIAEPDENGEITANSILSQIGDETKLVICTHAANTTGDIMPIEEIGQGIAEINQQRAASKGRAADRVLFLVDAAQSAGSVPINVEKLHIDMLAAPGHKALLGPQGTGFLYVANNVDLMPILEGGTGTLSKELELRGEMPDSFEVGTVNSPGIIGLGYGVDFVSKIGVEAIQNYEEDIMRPFEEALRNMKNLVVYGLPHNAASKGKKTAVVLFNIKGKSCEEVTSLLNDEFDIAVRGGFHCAPLAHKTLGTYDTGAVRISAGPFNTAEQLRTALDAIHKITKP